MRRWQVVARMHVRDQSWIVPISEKLPKRYTRLGAWLTARRRTARYGARVSDNIGPGMTWEARRAPR